MQYESLLYRVGRQVGKNLLLTYIYDTVHMA